MNILGIGTDIIEVTRIEAALRRHGRRFLQRIFTEKERLYCLNHQHPLPHLAARWCAKEAVAKALGTGLGALLSWQEIEIDRMPTGAPEVLLSTNARERFRDPLLFISMSHCKQYAVATALHCRIFERGPI